MEVWLCHKLSGEFFPLLTLQQQTKREMEKSLCTLLAAVIFLGGFLDAALPDDAATHSSLLNNTTTARPVTVEPQDHSTDTPTPTTAQTQSPTTTRDKQLHTKTQDSEEEKEETDDIKTLGEKTQL